MKEGENGSGPGAEHWWLVAMLAVAGGLDRGHPSASALLRVLNEELGENWAGQARQMMELVSRMQSGGGSVEANSGGGDDK